MLVRPFRHRSSWALALATSETPRRARGPTDGRTRSRPGSQAASHHGITHPCRDPVGVGGWRLPRHGDRGFLPPPQRPSICWFEGGASVAAGGRCCGPRACLPRGRQVSRCSGPLLPPVPRDSPWRAGPRRRPSVFCSWYRNSSSERSGLRHTAASSLGQRDVRPRAYWVGHRARVRAGRGPLRT